MEIDWQYSADERTRTYHALAVRFPGAYAAALNILKSYGTVRIKNTLKSGLRSGELEEMHTSLLHWLKFFEPETVAHLFFSAFSLAQGKFAAIDCVVPGHEDGLTAIFKHRIFDGCETTERVIDQLGLPFGPQALFVGDLNILGREAKTGGDIAFIFDVTDYDDDPLWLALCLQAKRVKLSDNTVAPIDSSGEDGANQVRRLSSLQTDFAITCAYVFYDNSKGAVVANPSAPLVKGIDHVLKRGADALMVNLTDDCVDLASYVLRLVTDRDRVVGQMGLEKILGALVKQDVTHLVTVSRAEDRHNALLQLATKFGLAERHKTLRTEDINFDSVINAPEIDWDNVPKLAETANALTFNFKRG